MNIKEEFREFLRESPMDTDIISYTNLRNKIQNMLKYYEFDINNSEHLQEIGKNIYLFTSLAKDSFDLNSGHQFILYIENKVILGAAMLKKIIINNGHNKVLAYEILMTTNFTKDKVKGLLYKLYSTFSKKFKAYIVSGDIQSPDSKKIWKRWLRDKENISEIFGYHYSTKKFLDYKQISNYWCESEKCKERRIVVKFK